MEQCHCDGVSRPAHSSADSSADSSVDSSADSSRRARGFSTPIVMVVSDLLVEFYGILVSVLGILMSV